MALTIKKTPFTLACLFMASASLAGSKDYLLVDGKKVKLSPVNSLSVPSVTRLTPKDRYEFPKDFVLNLPKPLAAPSQQSPTVVPVTVPVRLPPLVRFSVKAHWANDVGPIQEAPTKMPLLEVAEPKAAVVTPFTEGEFKILEALLLLKSEDTAPLSIGLANPLLQMSETQGPGHEIISRSLLKLKIRTAAIEHLNDLIKTEETSSRHPLALKMILSNLSSTDYDEAEKIYPLLEKQKINEKEWANLPLAIARSSLQNRELEKAWSILEHVPAVNSQTYEARYLRAMIQYRSNSLAEATQSLESLARDFDKIGKDLRSLIASTLAQIYFQQGDYKKAYAMYRKVGQEHPLWIQTLVETAWSQILNKDYEGAAGNMFSLHTSYFKGAYNPESYIVRTVSYLQLCQYGDALSVLNDFLRKYKFAQKQLEAYKKANPNHFETVRDFLKAGAPKKFAGLPRSLLIEIARDPQFIELQKKMNEIEEDAVKLSRLSQRLLDLDKQFVAEQGQLNVAIKELDGYIKKAASPDKRASLMTDRRKREQQLQRLAVLRRIILDAKQGIQNENDRFASLWQERKTGIKSQQAKVIQSSFAALESDLSHWLDQSELLFYEIHNGAGEHLRYQMASAEGSKALGSKPGVFKKGEKDQLWSFDGEIWEDEVGHYRSSLKNVCPEENTKAVSEPYSSQRDTLAQTNSN